MRERAALREAVILAKGQFINPVAGEFMALVEAGKPAVRSNVEGILRDHRAATADRRSVIDRFGIDVSPGKTDAVGQALAQANRARMKNGIARGRFIDEGLHSRSGDGA